MFPIYSLILTLILIGILIKKGNQTPTLLALLISLSILLLGTVGPIFSNTIRINESFNKKLIKYLNKNVYKNISTISIDAADEATIKTIVQQGYNCKTHHSFSYKAFDKEPNYDLVYKKKGLPKFFGIPSLKNIIKSAAITQFLDIDHQVKYGVTQFDIRVSKIEDTIFVDHGIIFATLDECIEDLVKAIKKYRNSNLYHIVIRKSIYNRKDFNMKNVIDNITIPVEINYKVSISNQNWNYDPDNKCIKDDRYIISHNPNDILNLIQNENCHTIEAHLTITKRIFYLYTFICFVLALLVVMILYYYNSIYEN